MTLLSTEKQSHGSLARRALDRPPLLAFLAVAAAGALCMAATARRDMVVRAAPGSAGLFAAIGLPVNLRGLDFRDVTSRILDDGAQRVLAVEGDIVNLRSAAEKLPDIRIVLRGADARMVYAWTAPPPKKEAGAGEAVRFRARLAAPPAEGVDTKLTFAAASAAAR
jgi:hypothetical protein